MMIFVRVGRPILNQVSVDHPLSPNEDLESFDRAIGTKTRIPDRHGHKPNGDGPGHKRGERPSREPKRGLAETGPAARATSVRQVG